MNNKLFAVVTSAILLLTAAPVFAPDFPVEAAPGNIEPRIYLIIKGFDIGLAWDGGSTPPESVNPTDLRAGQYAFTGENIVEIVVVRDLNGADDISYAKVTVDGLQESLCFQLPNPPGGVMTDQIPEWQTAPAGFDARFDKLFHCIVYVEPSWYGSSSVNIDGYDQSGAYSTMGIAQLWFFNPAIILDLDTNDGAPKIWFEDGVPGQTVMSRNKLIATNLGEGGVDLYAWISSDDLTDPTPSGALCPFGNVLDVDAPGWGMEYRTNKGTYFGNWVKITNPFPTWCSMIGAPPVCEGAKGIIDQTVFSIDEGPFPPIGEGGALANIIRNMQYAEVQFRLTYPIPCVGDFTEGLIHLIVRAV